MSKGLTHEGEIVRRLDEVIVYKTDFKNIYLVVKDEVENVSKSQERVLKSYLVGSDILGL